MNQFLKGVRKALSKRPEAVSKWRSDLVQLRAEAPDYDVEAFLEKAKHETVMLISGECEELLSSA